MGLDVRNRFLFNTSICGGNFREFRPVSKILTREAPTAPGGVTRQSFSHINEGVISFPIKLMCMFSDC